MFTIKTVYNDELQNTLKQISKQFNDFTQISPQQVQLQETLKRVSKEFNEFTQIFPQQIQLQKTLKQIQNNSLALQQVRQATKQISDVSNTITQSLKSFDFSIITQINKQYDISIIQKQIQSIIKSLPSEDYLLLQQSASQISQSLSDSIANFHDDVIEYSDDVPDNNVTYHSKKYIFIHIFLYIISLLLSPVSGNIEEDVSTWLKVQYEDLLNIDLTGEVNASIRTDTYLRAGRSKNAPIILSSKLKIAQPIIWHVRQKNWVEISVYVEGETHTGWVEKSKILK